jgi:hypothetical protein
VYNLAYTSANYPYPPNKVVDLKAAGFTSEERRAKGDDGARRFAHRNRVGTHNKIVSDKFLGPDQRQDKVSSAEFTYFRDMAEISRRRYNEMLAIRNPIMPNEDRRMQAALRYPNPTFDPTARPSRNAFLPPITQGRDSNGMLMSSTISNEHVSRSFKSADGDLLERVRQGSPSPPNTARTEHRDMRSSLKQREATVTSSRTVRSSTVQQRLCVLRNHESAATVNDDSGRKGLRLSTRRQRASNTLRISSSSTVLQRSPAVSSLPVAASEVLAKVIVLLPRIDGRPLGAAGIQRILLPPDVPIREWIEPLLADRVWQEETIRVYFTGGSSVLISDSLTRARYRTTEVIVVAAQRTEDYNKPGGATHEDDSDTDQSALPFTPELPPVSSTVTLSASNALRSGSVYRHMYNSLRFLGGWSSVTSRRFRSMAISGGLQVDAFDHRIDAGEHLTLMGPFPQDLVGADTPPDYGRWDELYAAAAHLYYSYISSPEFASVVAQPLSVRPGSQDFHFGAFSGWVDDVGARYDADTSPVVPYLRLVWFGALHNGWTRMWHSSVRFSMIQSQLRLTSMESFSPTISNGFPRVLAQTLLFPEAGTESPLGLWVPFWPENILAGKDDIGVAFNGWTYSGNGFFHPPPSRHRDFHRLAKFGVISLHFLDDVVLVMAKIHLWGGPVFADMTAQKIRAAARHMPFVRVGRYQHWDAELGFPLPRYPPFTPDSIFDDVYVPVPRLERPQCFSLDELLDGDRFPSLSIVDDLRRENLCAEIFHRGNKLGRVPQSSCTCERIHQLWYQRGVCQMSMTECAVTLYWHRLLELAVLPQLSICSSAADHEAVRRAADDAGGGTYILAFASSEISAVAPQEVIVAVAWPVTTVAQLVQVAGHFSQSGLHNTVVTVAPHTPPGVTVVTAAPRTTPLALDQTFHQLQVTAAPGFVVSATDDGVITTDASCKSDLITLRIWSVKGFGPVAMWQHFPVTVHRSNTMADIIVHLSTMCSFDLRDSFLRRRAERLPLTKTVQELGLVTMADLTLGKDLGGGADNENPRPRQRPRVGNPLVTVASPNSAAQRARFYREQIEQRPDGAVFLKGAIASWDDAKLRQELRALGVQPVREERTAVIRQRLLLALDLGFCDAPTVDSLRMVISEHFNEDSSTRLYPTKPLLFARFHELVRASTTASPATDDIAALFNNDGDTAPMLTDRGSSGDSTSGLGITEGESFPTVQSATTGEQPAHARQSAQMTAPLTRARPFLSRAETSARTSFGLFEARTDEAPANEEHAIAQPLSESDPFIVPAEAPTVSTGAPPLSGQSQTPLPRQPEQPMQPRRTRQFNVPTPSVLTSLQERWRGLDTAEITRSVERFSARDDPVLTQDTSGWRQLVNFAATSEYIRDDFDDVEMRRKHFMTAVVIYCQRSPLIAKHDSAGYGTQPTLIHHHELAAEYFGRLYQCGVTLLGSGASFQQVAFSTIARRNLAGADTHMEPDPRSLCTFLSQLFAAADHAEQGRPFRAHNTAAQPSHASSSTSPVSLVPVAEDVRQRIYNRALQLAPAGLPDEMVSAALEATASHTEGTTFYLKHVDRLRKLGGTVVNDAVRSVSESQFVVVSGKRAAGAWISMVHEAIRHCTATRGNSRCLNLQSDAMTQVTFAVITRQFTSKGFSLHLLVPQVPGLPSPKKIKELLGEAAQGLVGSLFNAAASPEEVKGEVWNILLMALQQMLVLVFADFDFGFSIVVIFYIDHIPMFQSNALPFCMATREIAKFFEESQRQRTISLQHSPANPPEVLAHVEPEELRRSRMALLDWNRESQALQDVQFQRSYDMAVQRGLLQSQVRNRDRTDNNANGNRNRRPNNARRNNNGKGGGKGTGKGNQGKGGQRSPTDPHGMDKAKWATAYGTSSNGKKLCWWFSHGNKPCSRSPCAHVHAHPDKYNGKHYKDLSKSDQAAVMAACQQ